MCRYGVKFRRDKSFKILFLLLLFILIIIMIRTIEPVSDSAPFFFD